MSFRRKALVAITLSGTFACLTHCGSDATTLAPTTEDGGPGADSASPPQDDASAPDGGSDAAPDAPPPLPGLAARPPNTTCHAFTAPPTSGQVRLVDRFPNVPLTVPTGMFQRPGDNVRWYVTERAGKIKHFPNDPTAVASDVKIALDLSDVTWNDWDCSLAGIAFPPDFATSKHAYVSYCYLGPQTSGKLQVRISRFSTDDGGSTFDRASEAVVFSIDQQSDGSHSAIGLHTADAIRFGKDGYLYAAFGDGGPQGGGGGLQAQTKTDLRGKMLRFDVTEPIVGLTKDFVAGRQRYSAKIPTDNPFVGGDTKDDPVYAYGFRNPWQWHFDRKDGSIWLGDVGNGKLEEVDRHVEKGGNYGWGFFEGFACTNYSPAGCLDTSLKPPFLDYAHGDGPQFGNAVTGGLVYRGTGVPSLTGSYIFGDAADAHVWAVRNVDSLPSGEPPKELLFDGAPVSSFAEDQDGELFATILYPTIQYPSGRILALEEAPVVADPSSGGPPALLSETGCFEPTDPKTPLPALVPYAPNAELWSDGASKRRWLALPENKQLTYGEDGDLDFPAGTVLVKEFSVGPRRVETRFLVRQEADARWAGYTYVWKEDQTDATLLGTAGAQVVTDSQTWNVPSRAQCHQCHTRAAGTTLGLELGQLNHAITYSASGITANQLFTLSTIGFLPPIPGAQPNLAPVTDTTRSLEERARSYLHANCANCHRPDGPTFTPLDLRWWVPLSQMGICDATPTIDDLSSVIPSNPRLLAPGAPERSVLYWRLFTTDAAIRMPPVGRSISHGDGAIVVSDWIKSVTACP